MSLRDEPFDIWGGELEDFRKKKFVGHQNGKIKNLLWDLMAKKKFVATLLMKKKIADSAEMCEMRV